MLHRRPMEDDNGGGTRKPMNDTTTYSSKTWLLLDNPTSSAGKIPRLAHSLNHHPVIAFTVTPSPEVWLRDHTPTLAPLKAPLPDNIFLFSLSVTKGRTLLVRLEHLFEIDEPGGSLSRQATVDMNMFAGVALSHLEERSLTGVLSRADADDRRKVTGPPIADFGDAEVVVDPKDIRTFHAEYEVL